MSRFELKQFDSDVALAKSAALDFISAVEQKTEAPFLVALSGGRITKQFFNFTVEAAKARRTKMDSVHFFWADERCVPPDHPESNFILANDLLFKPLGIAPQNVHRLKGELPQEQAVAEAIRNLNGVAGASATLDLVLLGMGEDGHVASLFPNATDEVISCPAPFLAINNSPKLPPDRLSLSFAALKAAKQVWVLASGSGKETALRQSLLSGPPVTPLGRVLQMREHSVVYTDIK